MFHVHTTFDLADGVDLAEFRRRWDAFVAHLIAHDLIASAGPIAERASDTPLDTDDARPHRHFVVMSFRDRAQADTAWDHIAPRAEPAEALHSGVLGLVRDPVFSCWDDGLPPQPGA